MCLYLHIEEILIAVLLGGLATMAYLVDTPVLEALESSRLTYMTALLLPFITAVAWFSGQVERVSGVIRDWWQVLGALAVYESLKHLHANRITEWLGILPLDDLMMDADRWLFGNVLPLALEDFATDRLVTCMWALYVWGYYFGPVIFLSWAYFIRQQDDLFLRLRKGLVLGLLGGYVMYLLVPVAGPIFTIGDQFLFPIATQPFVAKASFDALRYNWDCFPSLHTTIPWALTFISWASLSSVWRIVAVFWSAGITLSTLILRFHYGIDLIAGFIWAVVVATSVRQGSCLLRPIRIPLNKILPHQRIRPRDILGIFFVLTGISALLAEQAFEKMLVTLLGASTPAITVVLAVYFLGLSVGAGIYAHFTAKVRQPIATFAALEGFVALWAIGIYIGFAELQTFFQPVLQLGSGSGSGSPLILALLRGVVAAIWILPPTLCMGASFPAMVDAISRTESDEPRRSVSRIYTLNLLGALLGAALGPTITFPRWGIDGTVLFAALLDGIVCLYAMRLASFLGGSAEHHTGSRETSGKRTPAGGIGLLLTLAFLSGFVFFSLEVLWTHLLSAVLGNSVYVFSAMLVLVLFSLLIGGVLSTAIFPRTQAIPVKNVGFVLLLAAMLLAVQDHQWPEIPAQFSLIGPQIDGFLAGEASRWWLAAKQIIPVATLMGMIYPLLFRLEEFPLVAQARNAGMVSMANTVACIAGALLTGFILIPHFGSEITLRSLGGLIVLAGLLVCFRTAALDQRWMLVILATACLVAILVAPRWNLLDLTSGEHVYFKRNQVWPESKLEMFHEDTHGGMTTVVSNPSGIRGQAKPYLSLLTNGKFQGNDAWEMEAQTGVALISGLLTRKFDHACVIGLGTGRSALAVDAFGFNRIDIAEISPGIARAAREHFSHINGSVLDKAGVHLWLEDGRNLLLLRPQWRCDLITMEISSVWFAGATNLYSREFYSLARSRLAEDGILQQWIQLHHIGRNELGSVMKTIQGVFPYVGLWVYGGQGIVVASNKPLRYMQAAQERFVCGASVLGVSTGEAMHLIDVAKESLVLAPAAMRKLVLNRQFVENTDRNRFLEYTTPRYNLSRVDHAAENLRWFRQASMGGVPSEMTLSKAPQEPCALRHENGEGH